MYIFGFTNFVTTYVTYVWNYVERSTMYVLCTYNMMQVADWKKKENTSKLLNCRWKKHKKYAKKRRRWIITAALFTAYCGSFTLKKHIFSRWGIIIIDTYSYVLLLSRLNCLLVVSSQFILIPIHCFVSCAQMRRLLQHAAALINIFYLRAFDEA